MKRCKHCGIEKDRDSFYGNGLISKKTGLPILASKCKSCKAEEGRSEKKREYIRKYQRDPVNKARRVANDRRDKDLRAAQSAERKATQRRQTPDMNIAERVEIEAMYMYNKIMPGNWDVDHIVALANGGLHHPSNLQVLSMHENRSKGARL